jgi:cell division protein FtsB
MIYLLIFVVLLVAYFVYHAKSMGYQLRSVQKHSQEVQKAIDTMASVAAPTGQKVQGIPHIQDAQRNMNRILSKYPWKWGQSPFMLTASLLQRL